jgi:hypothetical protein
MGSTHQLVVDASQFARLGSKEIIRTMLNYLSNIPLDAWYCAQLHPTEDRAKGPTHRPRWDVTGPVVGPNSCPSGYVSQYKSSTFPDEGLSFRNGNAYEKTFPGEGIVTVPN